MVSKLILLAGLIFSLKAFPSDDLVFYVHGGAMESYIKDKLIVKNDYQVIFTTISPTLSKYPNDIGSFEFKITPQKYKELKRVIIEQFSKIPMPKFQPPNGSIVEELHFGNKKIFWTSHTESKAAKIIRKEFRSIAIKAIKHPVNAINVECKQVQAMINCHYTNIGKKEVKTIDPLGVSHSIFCNDEYGQRQFLHTLDTYNPKKLRPKKIIIPVKDRYDFKVKTAIQCKGPITVKTTNMLINNEYKDLLLGETVSK